MSSAYLSFVVKAIRRCRRRPHHRRRTLIVCNLPRPCTPSCVSCYDWPCCRRSRHPSDREFLYTASHAFAVSSIFSVDSLYRSLFQMWVVSCRLSSHLTCAVSHFPTTLFLTWSGTLAVILDNMEVRYCSKERVVLPLSLRSSRLSFPIFIPFFLSCLLHHLASLLALIVLWCFVFLLCLALVNDWGLARDNNRY